MTHVGAQTLKLIHSEHTHTPILTHAHYYTGCREAKIYDAKAGPPAALY